MILALVLALVADGPFSKFDNETPTFAGRSSRGIYDIERCLIDVGGKLGAPVVYSQPDRPGEVQLLWINMSRALRRIDLKADGTGTMVKAWHPRERAAECAGL
jgi:hypothetical protein